MGSIPIGGIARHDHSFAEFRDVDGAGFEREYGWLLDDDLDQRGWSVGAEDVERCARVSAGMGVVDFFKVETAVGLVEDALQ